MKPAGIKTSSSVCLKTQTPQTRELTPSCTSLAHHLPDAQGTGWAEEAHFATCAARSTGLYRLAILKHLLDLEPLCLKSVWPSGLVSAGAMHVKILGASKTFPAAVQRPGVLQRRSSRSLGAKQLQELLTWLHYAHNLRCFVRFILVGTPAKLFHGAWTWAQSTLSFSLHLWTL